MVEIGEGCEGGVDASVGDGVQARVKRFAVLRAAQRALAPSSREPIAQADLEALRAIRERLGELVFWLDKRQQSGYGDTALEDWESARLEGEVQFLDGALDGYAKLLLNKVSSIPIAQLRASLAADSKERRVEILALLQVCMDAEASPSRYLHVVDFLITLLCSREQDGTWLVDADPANLNETVRERCWQTDHCGPGVESRIAARFQDAAQQLGEAEDERAVLVEVSAYKTEIASFFFVPAVLRCIVGYNVAARNHFESRLRARRVLDSAIDQEIGVLDPLAGYEEGVARGHLPPHESPGVLSVQECVHRRILEMDMRDGPAARIASKLDLSWLEAAEREAFLAPEEDDTARVIRMTVLLGHLAVVLPECGQDFSALGLDEAQLDAWICALGDEVQSYINSLIINDSYDGAVSLGDTKSRFLTAVLIVSRRRHDPKRPRESAEEDHFDRDAIALVREYLERERFRKPTPMFFDLFGGGWRRTAALGAVALVVGTIGIVQLVPDTHPRAVRELSERKAREISFSLEGGYRDHAAEGSIFVGTLADDYKELDPHERHRVAEKIRSELVLEGVEEVLLYDSDRVLQAHYKQGGWRVTRAWKP